MDRQDSAASRTEPCLRILHLPGEHPSVPPAGAQPVKKKGYADTVDATFVAGPNDTARDTIQDARQLQTVQLPSTGARRQTRRSTDRARRRHLPARPVDHSATGERPGMPSVDATPAALYGRPDPSLCLQRSSPSLLHCTRQPLSSLQAREPGRCQVPLTGRAPRRRPPSPDSRRPRQRPVLVPGESEAAAVAHS